MHAIAEQITERFLDGGTVQGLQGVEKRGTGGREIDSSAPNGGIAGKVRTVEEQAEVRDSMRASMV